MAKKNGNAYRWFFVVVISTFLLSLLMSGVSQSLLPRVNIWISFFILIFIIMIGIVFDIIGISVASGSEAPFHSMAARGIKGAKEAIALVKKAEKVSNFCNDVIGDICGIVSGGATAVIVTQMMLGKPSAESFIVSLLMTGLVSALTVGGKGLGKSFAMTRSTDVIYFCAVVIHFLKSLVWRKKNGTSRKNK